MNSLRVFSGALSLALLIGCEAAGPQESAEPIRLTPVDEVNYTRALERIPVQRETQLASILERPVDSEATRPERVDAMLEHLDWYVGDQASDLRNNTSWGGRLLKHDLERGKNQFSRDERDWLRILAGNPDVRIPRHAVRMFY